MYHTPQVEYNRVLLENVDKGTLEYLWYNGNGSKNLSEKFVSELNRILLQIANNISKLNDNIELTKEEIENQRVSMESDKDTLEYLWSIGGGRIILNTFVSELNRILFKIAKNVSELNNKVPLGPEEKDLMYHIPQVEYNRVLLEDVDKGTLEYLWYNSNGSRSLSETFVKELNRRLIQIADNVSKLTL